MDNRQQSLPVKDLTPKWTCPDCGAWGYSTASLEDSSHPRWRHKTPEDVQCKPAALRELSAWAQRRVQYPMPGDFKSTLSTFAMNCDVRLMELQRGKH